MEPSKKKMRMTLRSYTKESSLPHPEQKIIHEYICNLFDAPLELYMNWRDSNFEDISEDYEFDPNSIKRSHFLESYWPQFILQEYSKRHPNQDLVLFEGVMANYLASANTFSDSRNLMLSSMGGCFPGNIFLNFQGEHLLLEDVQISKFWINVFVQNWMKMRNDRLKSVILQLQRDSVIRDLKFEKFSGRIRQFQYDSPIKGYHKFPNGIFDCSEGWKIRRETDGKVATIKITEEYFMFLVW